MHVWSQLTSLSLATLGMLLALWPRPQPDATNRLPDNRPGALTDLQRWPPFWCGLAVLGYILVQALNPAWRRLTDGTSWWLEPVAYLRWLPAGIDAPFDQSSPWRQLVVYAALLMLAGSVWIGFTRRKSYRLLLTLLAGNAALLAVFGLVQRLAGTPRIFWSLWPSNDRFIASFIYPNHAGAYFNLMTALAAGLAWWSHRQLRRSPGPAARLWLLTGTTVLTGSLVIHTYSRMSALMLLAFLALLGALAGFRRLWRRPAPVPPPRRRATLVLAVVAGLMALLLTALPARRVWARFAEQSNQPVAQRTDRSLARQAALDMLRDRWLLGWGAGGFRHGFPLFAKNYPAIYRTPAGVIMHWEHAHNDWLEFPLELGLVGILPILAGLGWLGRRLIRSGFWRNPVSLPLILGCALALLHAWVDFVFQNPALLFTWTILLVAAVRWTELEQAGIPMTAAPGPGPRLSRRTADTREPDAS